MLGGFALVRALDPLGIPPPVSDDYVKAVNAQTAGDWGMYLNDSLGDCVIADCAHQVMLHTANAGKIVLPTDADALATYEAVGGYNPADPSTDQGCDESAACAYMQSTGIAGQKSAGSGMIDPSNLDHIRWTVQLFGACRLGISVTDDMMQQFSAGEPWVELTGNVEGGHDVPIVQYDMQFAYVVTWRKLQPVAWSLVANGQWLDEAHGEVWPDFLNASGLAPSGFNLAQLLNDLPAIA